MLVEMPEVSLKVCADGIRRLKPYFSKRELLNMLRMRLAAAKGIEVRCDLYAK